MVASSSKESKNCIWKDKSEDLNQFLHSQLSLKTTLICGESLALFFLVNYLLVIIGYWLNISLIQYSLVLSFLIAIIFGYLQLRPNNYLFLLFLLIILLCITIPPAFTSNYSDFGWDSNVFHELMVISLSNGQNPIINPETAYLNQTQIYSSQLSPIMDISEWVRSKFIREAKGFHILAGSFFALTHDLQSSKSITIIGSIMSIFLCFSLLSCIFRTTSRILLAFLSIIAGINSIVICSSLSFYVDGFLYASFLSLMSLFGLFLVLKRTELLYIALGFSVLFINIKSTAIIFFVLLLITVFILLYFYERELLKKNLIIIIPFVILCALCSYHPYIHNYLEYNDISGGSIQEANNFNDIPNSWKNLSTPQKFILSLFSKADVNPVSIENSILKIPLLDLSDSGIYVNDPPKVGGWGPLFSGIFIIALLFFIYQIYRFFIERSIQENSVIFIGYLVMILVSTLVFQLSWYARYVPQVILLPLLMILPFMKKEKSFEKIIRIGVIILMLLNIFIVGYTYLTAQQQMTDMQNEVFSVVKEKMGNKIFIGYEGDPYSSMFVYAYVYELINKGIDFSINPAEVEKGMQLPTIISRDFILFGSAQGS